MLSNNRFKIILSIVIAFALLNLAFIAFNIDTILNHYYKTESIDPTKQTTYLDFITTGNGELFLPDPEIEGVTKRSTIETYGSDQDIYLHEMDTYMVIVDTGEKILLSIQGKIDSIDYEARTFSITNGEVKRNFDLSKIDIPIFFVGYEIVETKAQFLPPKISLEPAEFSDFQIGDEITYTHKSSYAGIERIIIEPRDEL